MSGHIPSGEMRQFITRRLTQTSRSDVLGALEQHGRNQQVGVAVTLYTRIWEAFGSNLRGEKLLLGSFWFSSDLAGKCGVSTPIGPRLYHSF
jgi:hypothetical protein